MLNAGNLGSGSKFFILRAAPILEAILGIVFKIFFLGVRKSNFVLATLLSYSFFFTL